ncbi:MAG: dihydrofolate reductase family protein, partial [Proteobacteria bacterium]|nr:dihydrofolate reductase family protein [Pseudomonadota bacterium]
FRIVVDTNLRTPTGARIMTVGSPSMTLIAVGEDVPAERLEEVRRAGVSTFSCAMRDGRVDLTALMDILGRRSITSILVEGGATLMGAMIRERLIDKFYFFVAPKILGGDDGVPMAAGPGPERIDQCLRLNQVETRRLGDDILLIGYPEYGSGEGPPPG